MLLPGETHTEHPMGQLHLSLNFFIFWEGMREEERDFIAQPPHTMKRMKNAGWRE